MGKEQKSHADALANIQAWVREMDGEGLDAVVINASGCGTTVKDYGHMFRTDPKWAEPAQRVASITRDVSEVMLELGVQPDPNAKSMRVAYHAACSLQHGQQVKTAPKDLLKKAGFTVVEPAESHLCCGSAGTYNLMQPELASQLKARKVGHLEARRPEVIATGNIGCMTQIGSGTKIPVVHTVELLDWASGGPKPSALEVFSETGKWRNSTQIPNELVLVRERLSSFEKSYWYTDLYDIAHFQGEFPGLELTVRDTTRLHNEICHSTQYGRSEGIRKSLLRTPSVSTLAITGSSLVMVTHTR